jgi:hypothetical protein
MWTAKARSRFSWTRRTEGLHVTDPEVDKKARVLNEAACEDHERRILDATRQSAWQNARMSSTLTTLSNQAASPVRICARRPCRWDRWKTSLPSEKSRHLWWARPREN